MSALEDWIDRQYARSAAGLLQSISPTGIVKVRERFHQVIVPRPGSVVASPVLAAYDPDPDYFFHWYRDAALVIDALRRLRDDGLAQADGLFADYVAFSLGLDKLDGRTAPPLEAEPDFTKFLRRDIASAHGAAIAAETRVNPDGTLDVTDWPRPQHDGPALRALTCLRWNSADASVSALLRADLAFVLRHGGKPCFDIWEEEMGLHYYTLCVSAAALAQGAVWLAQRGEMQQAQLCRDEAENLRRMLGAHWRGSHVGSRQLASGILSPKDLDISVILAALHAGGDAARDPRLEATLARLETLFDAAYAINQDRPSSRGPALGRYAGDTYYSGGAYYFSTLGAAEFCFRRGERARGDAYLETVRAFTPPDGALSEQFDQSNGAQTSAKDLAWSYAAFITCIAARKGYPA